MCRPPEENNLNLENFIVDYNIMVATGIANIPIEVAKHINENYSHIEKECLDYLAQINTQPDFSECVRATDKNNYEDLIDKMSYSMMSPVAKAEMEKISSEYTVEGRKRMVDGVFAPKVLSTADAVTITTEEYKELLRDAKRYRFLRDESNWMEDGGCDSWSELGEATEKEFDLIVDRRMLNS